MTSSAWPGLIRLNTADEREAARMLHAVCHSRSWSSALVSGRPYADIPALLAASDTAMAHLTAADLDEAMAGHPPIGRPTAGDPVSAREQRGVDSSSRAELRELNLTYQERHGHVFLICATGRSGDEMLTALRERIGNAPDSEREVVRSELGKINRIRLTQLVKGDLR